VIQSIPNERVLEQTLVDSFPIGEFDVKRPGIEFLAMKALLDPLESKRPLETKDLLYWRRSHHHWTPLAHRISGEALAQRILAAGLLH